MTDRTSRRAIVYSRVSTDHQADTGHGIEAQRQRGAAYVVSQGWPLPPEHVDDVGVSGSVAPDSRAGLADALARLDAGEADVLVTASLSRLGRKVMDVLILAERAQNNGWGLVVLDLALDTTTPTGEFSLVMLAAVAQLERRLASQRTKDALATMKARGERLGRPVSPETMKAGARAIELRRRGGKAAKWAAIARRLNADQYSTPKGGQWTGQQVRRAVESVRLSREQASIKNGGAATTAPAPASKPKPAAPAKPAISFGPVGTSPESRSFDVLIDGAVVGDGVAVSEYLEGNGEYLVQVDHGAEVPAWAKGFTVDQGDTTARAAQAATRRGLLERWADHHQG